MSEGPKPLDIARFNLEAYSTAVEMHTKLIKAYADYNFRMMEVLEKRIQIETAIVKLRILQDAFLDFRLARRNNMRQVRSLEEKLERHTVAIQRIGHLGLGETIRQSQVSAAWRGFWYLTTQSPPSTVLELGKPKCRASDRKGANWYRPGPVDSPVEDCPSSVGYSFLLMDWARKESAVPKLGSPPLEKLAELLEILGSGAAELVKDLKAQLKAAEAELLKLRAANWKTMNLVDKEPKQE